MNNKPALTVRAILVATIILRSISSTSAVPPGLVSWYQAENNTLDSQGVNNGTAVGTVNYAPGAVGQGFSLSNAGYVNIASPTLNSFASAFTVAGWFVITATHGNQPSLLNFRNSSNNSGFTLEQDSGGNINFAIAKAGGGGSFTNLSSTGWLANTPYYVAATFDGTAMTIFRNGVAIATRTDAADTMALVSSPLMQIGRNIVNGSLWDGKIDEVQFYSRALTPAEVASLAVPEPATTALLIAGFVGVAAASCRRAPRRAAGRVGL